MPTPEMKQPRIYEVLGPTVQKVCQFVRPSKPQPKFTLTAMFERSLVYEEMVEKAAKLETFRALEVEHRAKLVAALSQHSYQAEQASYRISQCQWESMTGMLSVEYEAVVRASNAHDEMLDEIKEIERYLADKQRELDDSRLWEQEVVNG